MIYNILSSSSFCDSLASSWIAEKQDRIWGLSHITVFVPTNRAAKTLKEAFLRQSGGKTLLLPKILSFADIDFFSLGVSDAISPLARQLLLSKLVQKKQSMSQDKAFVLASSLAELIDQMHNYDVDFQKIKEIAPDNFASHWQQTISFLEIIEIYWPLILKDREVTDAALRQKELIENLIRLWDKNPPKKPVIAVGFTGGLPIIERFLKAVYSLPVSDIYIPNLDMNLSDEEWNNLDNTHPQFYMKRLLDKLAVSRSAVVNLNEEDNRFVLLSTALKPASQTANWHQDVKKLDASCIQNVRHIECKTPQTEAFEIACILREVLETPEKTAALVTTDRNLARRVKIQMSRWGIELDDSAGTPLNRTSIGTFLLLLAEAAISQKPKDILALLKHPLSLDGDDFSSFRKKIHQFEKQARLNKNDLLPNLKTDLTPFMNLFVNPVKVPFEIILKTHLEVAQSLAMSSDKTGAERLWAKDAGDAASTLFTQLLEFADDIGEIDPLTYGAFLNALLSSVTVRSKYGMHPRLDILGPIEARLQQPDLVVIAGMNEDSFPQLPQSDAWINRPMREVLGLPAPEEKIGVSAQDFMHLFQAKEVVLTRSLKVDGTPTIASRWWLRLEAVLQTARIPWPVENEKYAKLLEKTDSYSPAICPAPIPPVVCRPSSLSISDIGTLLSNPYAVYAKRILKLYKLDEFDKEITTADFGNAVHGALYLYLKENPKNPDLDRLLILGEQSFIENKVYPQENPFLWEKFKRIATWFIEQKTILKPEKILLEVSGIMPITLSDGSDFQLKGRADRIDIYPNEFATVIDYKTGFAPTKAQVAAGFAPQLLLEALMLEEGCFEDVEKDSVSVDQLQYWKLSGKTKGGEITEVMPEPSENIPDIKAHTKNSLERLLNLYREDNTPYQAKPLPKHEQSYNDYAHLERRAEWQVTENEE